MIDFGKLQFLPIDIPNPPSGIANKLDTIPYSEMIPDAYRNCYHIPIMTTELEWTPVSELVPELVEWLKLHVFNWTAPSRVMVITTPSEQINHTHIDCSPDKFTTWQHKFRYVIRGNVSSLCFLGKNNISKHVPEIDKPFIMDGSWPHRMHNTYPNIKYTVALGSPWEPVETDTLYVEMLEKSYKKYKDYYMSSENLELPANYETFYKRKYIK